MINSAMITECWTPQSSHRDTFFSIYLVKSILPSIHATKFRVKFNRMGLRQAISHPSVCPSVRPSIHPSIHPSIQYFTYPILMCGLINRNLPGDSNILIECYSLRSQAEYQWNLNIFVEN